MLENYKQHKESVMSNKTSILDGDSFMKSRPYTTNKTDDNNV